MTRPSGARPARYHKLTSTSGELEMPCCVDCGKEMMEVHLLSLRFRVPDRKPLHVVPGSDSFAVCSDCRPARGYAETNFFCVPWPAGTNLSDALKTALSTVAEDVGQEMTQ